MSMITWPDIPAEYKDQVEELRTKIIESSMLILMMLLLKNILNEEEISIDEIKAALRKGVIERKSSSSILWNCI